MRTATPLIALAALVTLVATGCSVSLDGPIITASDLKGDSVTEARDVDGFASIEMDGSADLVVTQGAEFEVLVTTDSGLVEHIGTKVVEGELVVTQDYSVIGFSPDVTVSVTLPSLGAVELNGSSNATVSDVTGDALSITVAGSADVSVDAAVDSLVVAITGSGNVTAQGSAADLEVDISGSGDVDASALESRTAHVEVAGSGNVSVDASETLDVTISGSGDVLYAGTPRITQAVSGSGGLQAEDR